MNRRAMLGALLAAPMTRFVPVKPPKMRGRFSFALMNVPIADALDGPITIHVRSYLIWENRVYEYGPTVVRTLERCRKE
jgi:hypothetical protein